jgi:hypothetical protein
MKVSLAQFFIVLILSGCIEILPTIDGYTALADISSGAYVSDKDYIRQREGKQLQVWGYLDFSNISLNKNSIKKQPTWWDEPRDGGKSYFSLKSYKNNDSGESIRITINTDINQYSDIFTTLRDMKEDTAENHIIILVKGIVRSYTTRFNFNSAMTLTIEVNSPDDISFRNIKKHEDSQWIKI